jgi:transposase/molybdenum-dependent DNA-binding transcriptional regulator ModE
MPPSVADWLPEGHLAWFVLEVVKELDLSEFYATYRADGRGGATYSPEAMLAVLLYAYCTAERSSRHIERRCHEDVAYRVLAANQHPDHATLARFRQRHEIAISDLFAQILGLCEKAGLVDTGLVAIDGTKMAADVSPHANRTKRQLAEEILKEAERIDAEEDERFGDKTGDELPEPWASPHGRRERIREALRQLEEEAPRDYESKTEMRLEKEGELGHKLRGRAPSPTSRRSKKRPLAINVTDPDSREMWSTDKRIIQGYNAQAAATAEQILVAAEVTNAVSDSVNFFPIAQAAKDMLAQAGAEPAQTIVADAGYWSTANATAELGANLLIKVNNRGIFNRRRPISEKRRLVFEEIRSGKITRRQGAEKLGISYRYLGNAFVNYLSDPEPEVITDPHQRHAVIERVDQGEITIREGARELGVSYHKAHELLQRHRRGLPDPTLALLEMEAKLATPESDALMRKRQTAIEPVFGNIKSNRGYRRFVRRGLAPVQSEWRLICATHNVLKLWRVSIA